MREMGHLPRLMLLAVLVVATMAAAFYTWRSRDALEGFDEEEASAIIADGGSNYDKRMYVMKLFDALLKRKATSAELDEFAVMGSDTKILGTVIERYQVATERGPTPLPPRDVVTPTPPRAVVTPTPSLPPDASVDPEETAAVKVADDLPDQVCLSKADLLSKFQDMIKAMG